MSYCHFSHCVDDIRLSYTIHFSSHLIVRSRKNHICYIKEVRTDFVTTIIYFFKISSGSCGTQKFLLDFSIRCKCQITVELLTFRSSTTTRLLLKSFLYRPNRNFKSFFEKRRFTVKNIKILRRINIHLFWLSAVLKIKKTFDHFSSHYRFQDMCCIRHYSCSFSFTIWNKCSNQSDWF